MSRGIARSMAMVILFFMKLFMPPILIMELLVILYIGKFIQSPLMSSPFKPAFYESSRDPQGKIKPHHPGAQHKNIRVIMPSGHVRHKFISAQCCPYALMFIGNQACADTRTADSDPGINLSPLYLLCNQFNIIRVIT